MVAHVETSPYTIFEVSKKQLKCVDKKYVHIIKLSQVKDIWFRNKIKTLFFFDYISRNQDN